MVGFEVMMRVVSAFSLMTLVACAAPTLDAIIGVDNPNKLAAEVPGLKSHGIFIMTTRKRDNDPAIMYSGDRSEGLGLARITVTIPPDHVVGKVERPAVLPPDPAKEFTAIDPQIFAGESDFIASVNRALETRKPADRSILMFVHGYNTTLTDAVLRLGQFVEDSGYTGVPVLFSWASNGKLAHYVYDLNSTLVARDRLIRSSQLLLRTNSNAIDLVAHSMGNLLTVEVMRQASLQDIFDSGGRLRNIILASADIDIDLFKEQLAQFDPNERRFYVLISEDDKALRLSKRLAGGVNRVGDADAEVLSKLGVTVIDLTAVNDPNSIHHDKFASSPDVVRLIGGGILKGDSIHTNPSRPGVVGGVLSGIASLPGIVGHGGGRVFVVP